MAQDKKKVIVYADWIEKFEALEDDEAGRLVKHFFRYINDLNPKAPDRITELSFIDIQSTLKRDLKKWEFKAEKSRENGKLGGRPINPKEPTITKQVILEPKEPVNDIVIVNDIVNDNEKREGNNRPTKIDIENYLFEIGLNENCAAESERFFDYYSSNGWKVGKNNMKDWRAACRNWKKGIKNYNNGKSNSTPKEPEPKIGRIPVSSIERFINTKSIPDDYEPGDFDGLRIKPNL